LESLKEVMHYYVPEKDSDSLIAIMTQSIKYLLTHKDFDTFDRAKFITAYGNKISAAMTDLQFQNDGFQIRYNRLLKQKAKTLFDSNAYNVNAFAPGRDYYLTKEKAVLGKRLFFDVRLSGNGTRSCAS